MLKISTEPSVLFNVLGGYQRPRLGNDMLNLGFLKKFCNGLGLFIEFSANK
jgi:hypothetical protein